VPYDHQCVWDYSTGKCVTKLCYLNDPVTDENYGYLKEKNVYTEIPERRQCHHKLTPEMREEIDSFLSAK
jgi:hypothetical protein